jgi:hypothetical protein
VVTPDACLVRSLAEVTRKPNENADAVALRYEAIIAELRAQLADAREQREAWWQVADRTQRLVEAWQAAYNAAVDRAETRHYPPAAWSPRGH